jgi:hypothetical protein
VYEGNESNEGSGEIVQDDRSNENLCVDGSGRAPAPSSKEGEGYGSSSSIE